MDSDLDCVHNFKAGDLGGFEMLVKKYQNMAVNIAYALTGNSADAEDIAQEAFMKVYRYINSFRTEAKFSSWLYRIVVNTAYDFLRKNKRKFVAFSDVEWANIAEEKETGDSLAKEWVNKALERIPFAYRSVLVLKELEGMSYQDIAQTLKINIGTVESRIFRARKMLKEIFMKKGAHKDEM